MTDLDTPHRRAIWLLHTQASAQRTVAGDIRKHRMHGIDCEAMADTHEAVAALLEQLAEAAPGIWGTV